MGSQVGRLSKPLIAVGEGADVWLLPGVRPEVCPQIEVKREPLPTDVTLVWLFTSVNKLVSFQF